jgi:hypothetical protein
LKTPAARRAVVLPALVVAGREDRSPTLGGSQHFAGDLRPRGSATPAVDQFGSWRSLRAAAAEDLGPASGLYHRALLGNDGAALGNPVSGMRWNPKNIFVGNTP